MSLEDAMKLLRDDGWHARLRSGLTRVDELIRGAEGRIAEHAAMLEKSVPGLHAVSRELQHNLEEGLRFLMDQRGLLMRELAYIEFRKADHFAFHRSDSAAAAVRCGEIGFFHWMQLAADRATRPTPKL